MGYANLQECINDLEKHGELRRIDAEIDPDQEMAAIQRRVFRAGGPALLFTRPKGTRFPMLANLYGTRKRLEFMFRDSLAHAKAILAARAAPHKAIRHPWRLLPLLPHLLHMLPRYVDSIVNAGQAPVFECKANIADLPHQISWPNDGGPFVTLPLVHSENPDLPMQSRANLGMYRIQLAGNDYNSDEVGVHYQIHRGIGVHHARAMARGDRLPVHIYVGGPPCLAVSAVMPLPENVSELSFAGLLGGRRMKLARHEDLAMPVLAEADFCIAGYIASYLKPEGPFGDHLGYYSLRHQFPVLKVDAVWHRKGAIWPFTSVGRPPQEDTVFGDFIHDLAGPMIPVVFQGVHEVHAVDAAGVHPLLLVLGSERYTPYEVRRKPRELLTAAMHVLGTSQTALAKFVLIAACEDAAGLKARDVPAFLGHILERADLANDLHFLTRSTNDTLDYTGGILNEGSKLIWASAGPKRRELGREIHGLPELPSGFCDPRLVAPGILVIKAPAHGLESGQTDLVLDELASILAKWPQRDNFPLVAVVDDPDFCASSFDNFLWVVFTRTDPATDTYGVNARILAKHWSCQAPLILDARIKPFHPPVLVEDPNVVARVEALAAPGGPLHGCF